MRETACKNEVQVLEALREGSTPETFDEALRQHVEDCAACAELVSLHELFQQESAELRRAAPVPEAGRVWWRAMLAARRAAAERALLPIMIAEKAALAVGGGVLIALVIFAAPWLAGQLKRASVLAGLAPNGILLPFLMVTSVIICTLLAAGGLYALRSEK